MQLALEQTFPLGRFHATPWKVFPYDDPHGEWPPSPWRLVRAVLARSYQLDREIADSTVSHATLRESMVRAFAASEISWQLPPSTWRGPGLRQYHPAEFKRVPASAKEPGMMAYNTTKVLDNFWITSGAAAPVVWLFDGPDWTPPLLAHLDACLARMLYFGRAESITEIRRLPKPPAGGSPPVKLERRRTDNAVPVLALKPEASLAQLEATTDAPSVKGTAIPPGSRWMFAKRPPRPQIRPAPRPKPMLPTVSLVQFAIGSKVAPRYKDAVLITERFRSRALGCFTKILTGNPRMKWADAPEEVREQALLLSGRNPDGSPAKGHKHATFFLGGAPDSPSRLCVWRDEPFNDTEQRAILDAANTPLPLNYKEDPWTLNLVPLDKLVPPPPGFGNDTYREWKSLSPYVPPLHVYGRSGKEKPGCSVKEQLSEALARRGLNVTGLVIAAEESGWAKIHRLKSAQGERTNNDKLGYVVTLTFSEPVKGPISLGTSCHFGLGLFVPVIESGAAQPSEGGPSESDRNPSTL
ncbi:MAG: type I-U CRISPR-associated protein Csb2 [Limisphaerales bacterium]